MMLTTLSHQQIADGRFRGIWPEWHPVQTLDTPSYEERIAARYELYQALSRGEPALTFAEWRAKRGAVIMADSNPARDAAIAKCRKLSQMTTAAGCTENEAAMAAAKLAQIMAEHNLAMDEIATRAAALQCELGELTIMEDSYHEWQIARRAISTACSVRGTWRYSREDILGLGIETKQVVLKYFGFPLDVAAAIAMTEIVVSALNTETVAFGKTFGRGTREASRQERLSSFRAGMAQRLAERIMELKPRPPSGTTGTSLIVLKDQLVDEAYKKWMEDNNIRAGSRHLRKVDIHGPSYLKGRAAAENVRLGHNPEVYGRRQLSNSK